MKKLIITLLAVIAVSASVLAQDQRTRKVNRYHQKHQHGMMAKQLNFSENQKKQAKLYKEDFKKKMQELNKNESITVKEFRDRKEAIRKEKRSKMQGLLTVEQKNKMVQFKADRQKKRDEHFARHLSKLKTELTLSDAQVTQMRSQREKIQTRSKSIRDNESLTREQRKAQLAALREYMKVQRKNILTVEQLKKMEEIKKKNREITPVK